MISLENQVAVITGGSRGIGAATLGLVSFLRDLFGDLIVLR